MDKIEKRSIASRMKHVIIETAEFSTSHGIPNIVRSQSYFLKIMWLLCFLVSSGGCAYLVYRSISNYFDYEVVTKINVVAEVPAPFPTISFCVSEIFFIII